LASGEQLKQAKLEESAIAGEKLQAESGGAEEAGRAALRAEADLMHVKAQKDAYIAASQKSFQTDLDDIREAQIDPNHRWNSMSGAQKFSTRAAMFFGGILQGLRGGSNPAMEAYERSVDRDIAAQREALQNKKASFDAKRSLYAQQLAKYGDDERAVLAYKSLDLEAAKANVEKMTLASGSKMAQAQGREAVAALDAKQGEFKLQWAEADRRQAAASMAAAARTQAVPDALRLDEKREIDTQDSTGKRVQGYAPDPESARKLRAGLEANQNVTDALGRIVATARANPVQRFNNMSDAYQSIQGDQAIVLQGINTMIGAGVMSDVEAERIKRKIGDPTSMRFDVGGLAQTETARRDFGTQRDKMLEAAQVHTVQRVNLSNNGQVIPIATPTGQLYKAKDAPKSAAELGVKPIR